MKTSALLIAIVVALHCAALGALFFMQGCRTTGRPDTPPSAVSMPPTTKEAVTYPPPKPLKKAPDAKVESKKLRKALLTTEYIVRSGDSVGAIAKRYGISSKEIVDLNKLSDPNKLRVGQKLVLPGRLKIKAAPAKHSLKVKAVATPVAPAKVAAPVEPLMPVAAEALFAPAPDAGKEYVVVKGDSLSRIAKKFGTKIRALREANKLQGDKLKIGQKLIIPEVTAASPALAAVPAPSAPAVVPVPAKTIASSGITHIVQPSEDINSVAKLYAVTVDEIVELNQLGANRTVKVGQRLMIP